MVPVTIKVTTHQKSAEVPPGLQCRGRLHLEIHRLRAVAEHRHRQGAAVGEAAGGRGNGGGASGRLKGWDGG